MQNGRVGASGYRVVVKPVDSPTRGKQRRSQAERSEESRGKAIDAAIASLAEEGFQATTVLGVAARAGISRGGILHHFSGKVDLLEAAVRESIVRLTAKRRASLGSTPEGIERFMALTDAAWDNILEPEAVAILEIIIGSRSDPEMAGLMRPIIAEVDLFQAEKAKSVAGRGGLRDGKLIESMNRLHQAAMRGLLLELLFLDNKQEIEQSYELLKWYKEKLVERMQAEEAERRLSEGQSVKSE